MTDIEIAQSCELKHIDKIATRAHVPDRYLEYYGNYKAKIDYNILNDLKDKQNGKLILVTAITPTPAGEGKTTTTIGLADGLSKIGKNVIVALREPSLGPVFGVKGGAAGGGYAQVVPMEDINLHFTGDFHAIGAANNLLAAMIDNHIYQGNELNIDPRRIIWRRCVDMNDRQLRNVVDGLGGKTNGVVREDGYDITVASEVMAILCLATSISDLKERLGNIIVAYSYEGNPIFAKDLKANGAMTALLKDAFKPNLVQTMEGTPTIIHGGPFANIAHGCNSVIATKIAMKLGDYVVTEAGFGADLGAEKFLDIKCRQLDKQPDCVVLVATLRALKMHGGVSKDKLNEQNVEAVREGCSNLVRHYNNISTFYDRQCIVALNKFSADTEEEIECFKNTMNELGIPTIESDGWAKGGNGTLALANSVVNICERENTHSNYAYNINDSIKNKIKAVVKNIYHGDEVNYSSNAEKQIAELERLGLDKLPVCIAKTQYSFSDDVKKINAPVNFDVTVKNVKISNGAGFIVVLLGDIMTMPGLPKRPAAENIDVDEHGRIVGIF